jgi:hypothetical protein
LSTGAGGENCEIFMVEIDRSLSSSDLVGTET